MKINTQTEIITEYTTGCDLTTPRTNEVDLYITTQKGEFLSFLINDGNSRYQFKTINEVMNHVHNEHINL